MSWTHGNASNAVGATTATITAGTFASAPNPGEFLVAWVTLDVDVTITSNNGYTGHGIGAAGTGRRGQFFTKIAGASESTAPTWSFSGGGTHDWTVTVHIFTNTDGVYNVLAEDSAPTVSSTSHATPSIIPCPIGSAPDGGGYHDVLLLFGYVLASGTSSSASWSGYTVTGNNIVSGVTEDSDRGTGGNTGVAGALAHVVVVTAVEGDSYSGSVTSTQTDVGGGAILAIQGQVDTYSKTVPFTSTAALVVSHSLVPSSAAPLTSVGHLGAVAVGVQNSSSITSVGHLAPAGAIGVQATFTSTATIGTIGVIVGASATLNSVGHITPAVANVSNQATLTSTAALIAVAIQAYQLTSAFTSTGHITSANVAIGAATTLTSISTFGVIAATVNITVVFTSTSVMGPGSVGIDNSAVITSTSSISISVLLIGTATSSFNSISTITIVASITATAVLTSTGVLVAVAGIIATATLTSLGHINTGTVSVTTTAVLTSVGQLSVTSVYLGTATSTLTSNATLVAASIQALLVISALTSVGHLGPVDVLGTVSADITSVASLGPVIASALVSVAFTSVSTIATVTSVTATAAFTSTSILGVVNVIIQVTVAFTSTGVISGASSVAAFAVFTSVGSLVVVGFAVLARSAVLTSRATMMVSASVFLVSFTTFLSIGHLVVRGVVSGAGLVVLSPRRRVSTLIAGTGPLADGLTPRRHSSDLTAVRR